MGAIHFSIDVSLAGLLARELGISTFVETGTFKGDSVALVRSIFSEIHTCELSSELHQAALRRFEADKAVTCHLGSAGDLLKRISQQLAERPVLYWLDAHWCAGENTAGEESQCPLLEELEAIYPLHPNSVVWIDDARYFMSPPPKPHVSKGWPRWREVQKKLMWLAGDTHRFVFANDTILLYPNKIDELIYDYLWENGVDLVKFAYSYKEKTELAEWSKRLSEWDEQLKSWNKSLSIREKKLSSKIPQFLTKLFRQ
jgi:predicted O-methyltransferase YrrM